jgi:hypothetical protein
VRQKAGFLHFTADGHHRAFKSFIIVLVFTGNTLLTLATSLDTSLSGRALRDASSLQRNTPHSERRVEVSVLYLSLRPGRQNRTNKENFVL